MIKEKLEVAKRPLTMNELGVTAKEIREYRQDQTNPTLIGLPGPRGHGGYTLDTKQLTFSQNWIDHWRTSMGYNI